MAPRVGEELRLCVYLCMSTHGKWEMGDGECVREWQHDMVLSTAKHGVGGRTDGIRVRERETPMAWDSDPGLVFHGFRVREGLGMECS